MPQPGDAQTEPSESRSARERSTSVSEEGMLRCERIRSFFFVLFLFWRLLLTS